MVSEHKVSRGSRFKSHHWKFKNINLSPLFYLSTWVNTYDGCLSMWPKGLCKRESQSIFKALLQGAKVSTPQWYQSLGCGKWREDPKERDPNVAL